VNLMELPDNKWPAYLTPSVIVVFVVVSKSHSHKPQGALSPLVTEERYWALFYMPLCTFIQNLLNVLVQIASKMGVQKNSL
jgi:hypothetical protein